MEPKKCGIYVRVSTKEKQDLDTQLLPLREYAKARGWQIVSEWQDRESGSKEDRDGLMSLFASARKRQIDVVLVFRFDRFARSTKQLISAMEEFKSLGIDFVSYSEAIDTSSPAGRVMFTMVSAFAEFERSIIQERIRCGILKCRAKGIRLGRPVLNNAIRQRVFELKQEGLSFRAISRATGVSLGSISRMLSSTPFNKPAEIQA